MSYTDATVMPAQPEPQIKVNAEAVVKLKSYKRATTDDGKQKAVYIVEQDASMLQAMQAQIANFGYLVKGYEDLLALRDAIVRDRPSAAIIDINFHEQPVDACDITGTVTQDDRIPLIFLSDKEGFKSRLRAVRAGAEAYFVKPVNMFSIIDKLDELTMQNIVEPYRVLIVEDDVDLSAYYATILSDAGMNADVINDPTQILGKLSEFLPDIILMDMYMPGCIGQEIAKVIRQDNTYLSIPIVFLSGETDLARQLSAMRFGGDDFLTKPIAPEHLISSVTIRAERMRMIRNTIDCDSLTGLLRHTKIKEQLDIAIERSRRQNTSLCFAMVDIDKFKSVNDTYGHPVGDMVIISLAKLLKQRLRRTDLVGRYGGEEFAVILEDTGLEAALKVMDELRKSFGQVRHMAGGAEFCISFSCGIARLQADGNATTLVAEADRALYVAKKSGRDRVTAAEA